MDLDGWDKMQSMRNVIMVHKFKHAPIIVMLAVTLLPFRYF